MVITHAGLNTVLDSLAAGVPAVAIPIAFEQPAIAARVAFRGSGEVVPLARAKAAVIRAAATRVLGNSAYGRAAQQIKEEIARAGGVKRAAEVVEQAFRTGAPVYATR
jgi:UDP:flavonoid glycosyltransferase YjiC (YdhE family)